MLMRWIWRYVLMLVGRKAWAAYQRSRANGPGRTGDVAGGRRAGR